VSNVDRSARVNPVNDLAARGAMTTDLARPAVALAIGAHPDDIEFGCGATLAKWASQGTAIFHLVLSDGSKGSWDPDYDRGALVALRQAEQRRAATLLGGGEVEFCDWVDGELRNSPQAQERVARSIRTIRPDVVLGHDPWRRYRLHPDHRHAGFITTDAIVAARDPHFFANQGLAPHRPSALLLWEADEPNHVEDVVGFADTKIAALLAHESQHQSTMGIDATGAEGASVQAADAFAQGVKDQLSAHGALAGITQGESFHLITET
jgi:LmbE family N-acetylglucosaminyl deacetylase